MPGVDEGPMPDLTAATNRTSRALRYSQCRQMSDIQSTIEQVLSLELQA